MPLPRSLAHLKRGNSEKKWAEACQWAGERASKTKHEMPKSQRPDGGENRSLPHRAAPTLDEELAYPTELVVLVLDANAGAPLQGVPSMGGPVVGLMGGGAEGDLEVEEPVEGPGPPCRRESNREVWTSSLLQMWKD